MPGLVSTDMASSKILPGCLVSLAAVVVFSLSWVALPSVHSAEKVSELLARQQRNFEEDQKLARDPQQNAFIDPQWSPFWGRKSVEAKPHSKVEDAATALRDFGFLGSDDRAEIAVFRRQRNPALARAETDFREVLPALDQALHRSAFILPSAEAPHFETQALNYLALRSIAQALSAYSEVKLADGNESAALDATLQILALAKLVVGQKAHPLITVMIAAAIQTTGQETLGYLLQSSSHWNEGQLRKTLAALQSSPVSARLGLEALEHEFWVAQNTFAKGLDSRAPAMMRLPGVWGREWRLYQNDYTRCLEAARSGRPVPNSVYTDANWYLGRQGWLSSMTMPNFERALSLLEVSHQRQDFLHLYTELLLYKRQGRLPKELSPQWLRRLDPTHVSYRVEKGEPHLEYDLDSGLARTLPKASGAKRNGAARWENLMQAHWVMPVAP